MASEETIIDMEQDWDGHSDLCECIDCAREQDMLEEYSELIGE